MLSTGTDGVPDRAFGGEMALVGFSWSRIVGMTVLAMDLAGAGAQMVSTQTVLTPPEGNSRFLTTHAMGTQNYVCLGTGAMGAAAWEFVGPQALLSVSLFGSLRQQVATHFLSPVPGIVGMPLPACVVSLATGAVSCPTWQDSFDSSAVWGEKAASVVAGTDAACPNAGAIPCLLLKAVQTRKGTFDKGLLARTTYVQRLATIGGMAPAGSCTVGDQAQVPYQAEYVFWQAVR